jgi:hypothetical protein
VFARHRHSHTIMTTGPEVMVTPFIPTATQGDELPGQRPQSGIPQTSSTVPDGHGLPSLPSSPSIPSGLSDKELARLRADAMRSQHADAHAESSEPEPEPAIAPAATSEQDVPSPAPETSDLRFVVGVLQREVEELRAQGLGAPPSYTHGDS